MRLEFLASASVAAWLACAAGAVGQNLLVNPDFDTSLSGWTPTITGFATAGQAGGFGSPAPGSAILLAVYLDQYSEASLGQCVSVAAPASVELLVRYVTAAGEAAERRVRATFHGQPGCAGPGLETVYHSGLTALPDGWSELYRLNHPLPAGTQSAWIAVEQYAQALTEQNQGRFDHVRFGLAGTTPVSLESFALE